VSKKSTLLRRHRGAKQGGGAVSKESTQLRRTGVVLEGPLYSTRRRGCSLERESRSSVAGDAVKRYITMPSRHQRSSGSPSTLLTILTSYHFQHKYTLVTVSIAAIYQGCSSS